MFSNRLIEFDDASAHRRAQVRELADGNWFRVYSSSSVMLDVRLFNVILVGRKVNGETMVFCRGDRCGYRFIHMGRAERCRMPSDRSAKQCPLSGSILDVFLAKCAEQREQLADNMPNNDSTRSATSASAGR